MVAHPGQGVCANKGGDAAKAENGPAEFTHGGAFVGGEKVGDKDGKSRGGRVDNQSKTAIDMLLARSEERRVGKECRL